MEQKHVHLSLLLLSGLKFIKSSLCGSVFVSLGFPWIETLSITNSGSISVAGAAISFC